jgi:hypothetical protein
VHGWQTPPENRVPAPGTGGLSFAAN